MSAFHRVSQNIKTTSCIIAHITIFLTIHFSRGVFATCGQRMLSLIHGQTCDTEQNEIVQGLNHQQCTYQCLRRGSKCMSVSYSAIGDVCVMTATPCHALRPQQDVQTIVLHDPSFNSSKCLKWIPYNGPPPARSISSVVGGDTFWLARWQDPQGHLLVGGMTNMGMGYFLDIEGKPFVPPRTECHLVSVAEDCSIAWMPFTVGKPIPHNAAETGHIIGNGSLYVGRFGMGGSEYGFGFYMTGNPSLIAYWAVNIDTFEILVEV